MSAFMVSRFHIHQLVTALETYVAPTDAPTALGQMLWDENTASILYRYPDCTPAEMPGPMGEDYVYSYVTPKRHLMPIDVWSIAQCYMYQACEHPEWEASEACQRMEALCAAIETRLGKSTQQIRAMPEYEHAPYEIYDDDIRVEATCRQCGAGLGMMTTPEDATSPRRCKPCQQPTKRFSLTETAQLVRQALKAAYPTVKFSVRSRSYSMGCSINVSWTDGPTAEEVRPLLNHYNGADFDGMQDLKSYITQEYKGDIVKFGADYVTGQRRISPDFLRQVAARVATQYGVDVPEVHAEYGHVLPTPAALVLVGDAPPYGQPERLLDVIHHVAHCTSALPKPRIRVYPVVTEVTA